MLQQLHSNTLAMTRNNLVTAQQSVKALRTH